MPLCPVPLWLYVSNRLNHRSLRLHPRRQLVVLPADRVAEWGSAAVTARVQLGAVIEQELDEILAPEGRGLEEVELRMVGEDELQRLVLRRIEKSLADVREERGDDGGCPFRRVGVGE